MDIKDLSPALKDALMAEIEKELPRLLKKAEAAIKPKASAGAVRRRLPHGLAERAIIKALWVYEEEGATKTQILKMAQRFLDGRPLNENTLKRWLVVLRQSEKITNRDGLWFPLGARMPGVVKTRGAGKSIEGFDYAK